MRRVLSTCALVSWIAASVSAFASPLPDTVTWHPIGKDLEMAKFSVSTRILFSTEFVLFRMQPSAYRVAVVRASEYGKKRASAKEICDESRGILCINASFFDEQAKPLGLIVERGITIQKIHKGGNALTGIFQVMRNDLAIVNRLDYSPEKTLEAVQAGPRIISRGHPVPGLLENASADRRAGVCLDPEKRLIFFVLSSNVFGLPIEDLQGALLHKDIACWDALNLDGGGSAQLYVSSEVPERRENFSSYEFKGEDEVPVMLALFPKEL